MMNTVSGRISFFLMFLSMNFFCTAFAQGPVTEWYYNPMTDISWASCHIYFEGGSRQKVPFMPLITIEGAPSGTGAYTRDIDFSGPIVFVGNGIVRDGGYDCYNDIDVTGKAVMMCCDFPDSMNAALEKKVPKEKRIAEAVRRKAGAVVMFSYEDPAPFQVYRDRNPENVPHIPVITINRDGASRIFESAGRRPAAIYTRWLKDGAFKPEQFISKIAIRMEAKFDRIETNDFDFRYREQYISRKDMETLAAVNEKSVHFILDLFESEHPVWYKCFVVYYRDYDAKLFFTHHWGKGLSAEYGTFIVYDGAIPDFPFAVHENTHTLLRSNWGETTSFMEEGLGKYAQAQASDKNTNHMAVLRYLQAGELIPLRDMLEMKIGSDKNTYIAYPAAGSFTDFLISEYSLKRFRRAYELENRPPAEKERENTWQTAFGKSLEKLEEEWLLSLSERYGADTSEPVEFPERGTD